MKLNDLRNYFLKTLNPKNQKFSDPFGANDLQIVGKEEVKKISFGVDLSLEFLKKSKEFGADVVVTHHGIRFDVENFTLNEVLQNRLRFLYQNQISNFGFHFLLDWNEEFGNNAQILKLLNLKPKIPFSVDLGENLNWGWGDEFETEKSLEEIFEILNKNFFGNVKIYKFGKEKIKKIAVISGFGSGDLFLAKSFGADLFITGELKYYDQEIARELELNVIFAGHYITETFGVKALAEKTKKDLGLETEFIDVPNFG
ncbi:MAG: Nif3-like dinuclear metal center hexameric protein [Patescibacteria group bacterium]